MSNKIYEDLCYKDKRNPMYSDLYDEDDNPTPRKDCFCDNCFHGIDRRALSTLELLGACKSMLTLIRADKHMDIYFKAQAAIKKIEGGPDNANN